MIRNYLPSNMSISLFGDRKTYGRSPWTGDKDWEKWLSIYPDVYFETQRRGGLQKLINEQGYNILKEIDCQNKTVAEIGPGGGYHFAKIKGRPCKYNAIDVCQDFFSTLQQKALKYNIPLECHLLKHGTSFLPLDTSSHDILLSFYSLEHLNPLEVWMKEIYRVLRPGGMFIGAIPIEGGLAWGLGRYITSRHILKKKFGLKIEKIVCWEHPNMIDEMLYQLESCFEQVSIQKFPFPLLPYDLNLLAKFIAFKG